MADNQSLLLVLPIPIRFSNQGTLEVEKQAANGLLKWLEHFSEVTVCAMIVPNYILGNGSTIDWIEQDNFSKNKPLEIVPLPWSYHPFDHFRDISKVRKILHPLIERHKYLQFGIGGCTFGDWAAVAARIAYSLNREYSIHTDAVAHLLLGERPGLIRKLKKTFDFWTMKYAERRVIKRAKLALLHGADCYEHYKELCPNPHLVHDIHVSASELPSLDEVREKMVKNKSRPLQIIYVGRMIALKGPDHWLQVLSLLKKKEVLFSAKWYGDGPMRAEFQKQIVSFGLENEVQLMGYVSEKEKVISVLRDANILVFCHLTPESPRTLIESLNQATPIVGYGSHYSQDLIKNGGGKLVEMKNQQQLCDEIVYLDQNRDRLEALTLDAWKAGQDLTDTKVFSHRSNLIKTILN